MEMISAPSRPGPSEPPTVLLCALSSFWLTGMMMAQGILESLALKAVGQLLARVLNDDVEQSYVLNLKTHPRY